MTIVTFFGSLENSQNPFEGTFSNKSASGLTVTNGNTRVVYTGSGLAYDSSGQPKAGLIETMTWSVNGVKAAALTALHKSAARMFGTDNENDFFDYVLAGNDTFRGHSGSDRVGLSAGNDLYYGFAGSDVFDDHEGGNDTMYGGAGGDTMYAGKGKDTLSGQDGNDSLYGEAGNDLLIGGAGRDAFVFSAVTDSVRGAGRDIISDFSHAHGDKIDLSQIDANGTAANNGTFVFQATKGAAFTGVKGQLHYSWIDDPVAAKDKTIIEGDINGDRTADFQIELTGLKTLVAGDFVL